MVVKVYVSQKNEQIRMYFGWEIYRLEPGLNKHRQFEALAGLII